MKNANVLLKSILFSGFIIQISFLNANAAQKAPTNDFELKCLGESQDCNKDQVGVKNVSKSKKSYSSLVMVCADKDNPKESKTKPYYIWPFSLDPGETKCMDAKDHCVKETMTDKATGKKMTNYYSLIELDENDNPIWRINKSCK